MTGMNSIKLSVLTILALLAVFTLTTCKQDDTIEVFYEEEELLISAYLEEHSDKFSTLLRVLEITNIKPILNAYGHYTFFAPDNSGFELFCQDYGFASVDEFDTDYLVNLIKYHLLDVELEISFLPNGVLEDTTYSGDNLVFTFEEGGIQTILINDEATIIGGDINVENGRIHMIDHVLTPVTQSMYDKLAGMDEYSIFTEALELTGLDDTLKVVNITLTEDMIIKGRFTLFIESDQVFQTAGINSIDDLISKYSDTPDPTDKNNGLFQFMAYHCVPGMYFLNNLDSFNYPTLAEGKLIRIDIEDEILINRTIGGMDSNEVFIAIDKTMSNKAAKNGVFHSIDGLLEIFDPPPTYYKFEFTDYQGISINRMYDVDDLEYISGIYTEKTGLWYRNSILPEDSSYLITTSDQLGWVVEFDIPPISKGKYKVILHWVSAQHLSPSVQAFWDEQPFGTDFSMKRQKRPPRRPPEWLYEFRVAHELGVVNMLQTTSHKIKFVCLEEGPGVFDYITFWPE